MKIKNMIKTNTMRKYRKSLSIALATLLLAASFPVNGGTALAAQDITAKLALTITSVQHFGDNPEELGGTFVGDDLELRDLNLPGLISGGRSHLLMLQTYGVNVSCHVFEINGVQIAGALRDRNNVNEWVTEIAQIPANVLKASGNTLRIVARNNACGAGGDLDDFAIDNVVIFYR
jgi:hypothetical protein